VVGWSNAARQCNRLHFKTLAIVETIQGMGGSTAGPGHAAQPEVWSRCPSTNFFLSLIEHITWDQNLVLVLCQKLHILTNEGQFFSGGRPPFGDPGSPLAPKVEVLGPPLLQGQSRASTKNKNKTSHMARCITFVVARIRVGNRRNFAYFSLWHPKYGR